MKKHKEYIEHIKILIAIGLIILTILFNKYWNIYDVYLLKEYIIIEIKGIVYSLLIFIIIFRNRINLKNKDIDINILKDIN